MLVIKAESHKILVRIANREDTDQNASSEAVWSGSALFVWQLVYSTKCSKILNTFLFLFSTKKLVIRMLVRIANREDTDQTASSEAVWSGSALFV